MRLSEEFEVRSPRESVVELVRRDETLTGLFPDTETEIVERSGDTKTTRTRYRALGREREATFRFTFEPEGSLRFEKVCDGYVFRRLRGEVLFEPSGTGTRVRIAMEGATKAFVPELTIRGPMREQLRRMAAALRRRLEGAQ